MNKKLAQTIVEQIMDRLGKNINIMDRMGNIIASGDSQRVGTIHEGALEVINSGEELHIDSETGEGAYLGAKPGVNLPIRHGGEILGVVGITGQPEEVMEFGAMVVMMAELLIERSIFERETDWMDRLKGFLMEECLKEEQDIEDIIFRLKGMHIQPEPPFQMAVFRVKEGKATQDTYSAHYQIRNRLRKLPILYDFINESDFVILLISQQFNKFNDFVSFIMDVFKSHFRNVQVGLPQAYAALEDTPFHFKRTIQSLNITTKEQVSPEDLEAQLLITGLEENSSERFVKKLLGHIPANLINTLMVYFENNLNMNQTAKQLFLHRNTLIYRLNRVKDLVGLDPRQFKDAVDLQIAIWLYCTKNREE